MKYREGGRHKNTVPSEFIGIVFHTARRRKEKKESVRVRCSWKVAETFSAQRDVHLKVVKYGGRVREGVRTRVSRIRLTLNTLNYSYYHEHQLLLTACSRFTSTPTPCLSPNLKKKKTFKISGVFSVHSFHTEIFFQPLFLMNHADGSGTK